jgi:hypothetical protein
LTILIAALMEGRKIAFMNDEKVAKPKFAATSKKWLKQHDEDLKQFDTEWIAPLVLAHAAWMQGEPMVSQMSCNYDENDKATRNAAGEVHREPGTETGPITEGGLGSYLLKVTGQPYKAAHGKRLEKMAEFLKQHEGAVVDAFDMKRAFAAEEYRLWAAYVVRIGGNGLVIGGAGLGLMAKGNAQLLLLGFRLFWIGTAIATVATVAIFLLADKKWQSWFKSQPFRIDKFATDEDGLGDPTKPFKSEAEMMLALGDAVVEARGD